MPVNLSELIHERVREVADYPKQGIVFQDITPLLADPVTFATVVDNVVSHYGRGTVDTVVGIEARGFILAAPIAYHFGAGFVPIRKAGKLPSETLRASYDLEYGTETIEMHTDGITPGDRVVIVDDVLATGGTAAAAVQLVEKAGGTVVGFSVLLELGFLKGREKLANVEPHTLATV